jgi:hypothetical protein
MVRRSGQFFGRTPFAIAPPGSPLQGVILMHGRERRIHNPPCRAAMLAVPAPMCSTCQVGTTSSAVQMDQAEATRPADEAPSGDGRLHEIKGGAVQSSPAPRISRSLRTAF